MMYLKWILLLFEALFSLHINLDKSSIILVGDVESLKVLVQELGCNVNLLPITYPGLPLGARRKSLAVWDNVEEKFYRRLALWKRHYISRGGRITRIRSTLVSSPLYMMSIYRILKAISKRLEKIQRDFLWGGGSQERRTHTVNWDTVYLNKGKGGLGVRKLLNLNRALLGKWI